MEPGLGAVIFLTLCIIGIVSLGFFLVHRVMTKPGSHIGARLPRDDSGDSGGSDADRPDAIGPGPTPDRTPAETPPPDDDDGDDEPGPRP
ncbi:hypothetical protein DFO66_11042 [Brevibacterium sanguinis]|uniref:Uncharacterized protein n=2 Tax=Brevibacterium TaxID=1696 RepID=A0A366IEW3_9MICO|nr:MULTISPECIES: hypothetical protein [Brevibacterium]RBP63419.1 hypothetical protein DFO66_11042 [Brevibacterium sanguinis]RBP69886.1 hypothetical protein DFO65_11042 [Brevibacterium celere]